MSKKLHKQNERIHAANRAHDRFGIQWSKRIRKAALAQILGGAERVGPRHRQLYIVVIDGKEIVAAFDTYTREIKSLFPLEFCAEEWACERRLLLNQAAQRENEWTRVDLERQARIIAQDAKRET